MAKEGRAEPWNTTGSSSAVRNRKTWPTLEKTPEAEDEDASPLHGGTSVGVAPKGDTRHEAPGKVPLMLLVGLCFSTRLYKISEPPHVW